MLTEDRGLLFGILAHLGERLRGTQEAKGSSPLGSTKCVYSFTEKSTTRESMVTSGNGLARGKKRLSTRGKVGSNPIGHTNNLSYLGNYERDSFDEPVCG